MYISLWRALPGSVWTKVGIIVAGVLVVLAVLFYGVFPVVESLTSTDSTVAH